jgi:hypothetical protein
MGQSKAKRGRPSAAGISRSSQLSTPVTPDEKQFIIDVAAQAGLKLTGLIREGALRYAEELQTGVAKLPGRNFGSENSANFRSENSELTAELAPIFGSENSPVEVENPERNQDSLKKARTRASARTEEREEKRESSEATSSISLRSISQAAPVSDEPWSEPEPLRLSIKLSDGATATNTYLFANACRIPPEDVPRILETPSLRPLRRAMLHCFARSLRDCFRVRWCSAYNKRMNAWRDTARSNLALLKAAEYLAIEYAKRKMSANQFIDACDEMRPKSVRFVPVDMLSGAIGARVADWIPPEQRDRDRPWTQHTDDDGTNWVTPHGESPVPVIRTAADRERFLKANRIR